MEKEKEEKEEKEKDPFKESIYISGKTEID